MSKLGNQPERKFFQVNMNEVDEFIKYAKHTAEVNDITYKEAVEVFKILEYARRTDVIVEDGDFRDEQAGGFGELIEKLIEKLN